MEVNEVTKPLRAKAPADTRLQDKRGESATNPNDLLGAAMNETLKQIFNELGAKVVCEYLRGQCHLTNEELAEKPEVVSDGLKKLLNRGAPAVEMVIVESLYSRLALKLEKKQGYEFSDYIKVVMKKYGPQSRAGRG